MGTQLLAQGLESGECGMLWNVERPDVVRGVHEAYRQAGCRLITTNTFGERPRPWAVTTWRRAWRS